MACAYRVAIFLLAVWAVFYILSMTGFFNLLHFGDQDVPQFEDMKSP